MTNKLYFKVVFKQ